MSLPSPESLYLRQWWWSRQPFYKFSNAQGQGWGHLVDIHPGLFNLAWVTSGASRPPEDYLPYQPKVVWAFTEAAYIPMAGRSMADWAFMLNLSEFRLALEKDKAGVKRWKFHDKHMSYEVLLSAVRAASALRAGL